MVQLVDLDNMSGPPYLCVFHLATAGQQGPSLGSDEEEIVVMIYIVIDKALNKVVGIQQYLVKPNVANTNDSFLSSEVLLETSITEDLVRKSLPLEYVILQFDNYVRSLQIDPYQMKFVTDGELPLRQCLHPEACNKNIDLPEYYNSFIDLRKDFKAFYSSPDDMGSVREMIECEMTLSLETFLAPAILRWFLLAWAPKNKAVICIYLPGLGTDEQLDLRARFALSGGTFTSSLSQDSSSLEDQVTIDSSLVSSLGNRSQGQLGRHFESYGFGQNGRKIEFTVN